MFESPSVGQIACVPFDQPVPGWLPCEGQEFSAHENQPLFSLLGSRFGGDSRKGTFALPDLRGKEPAPGLKWIICLSGSYPPFDR